MRGRDDTGHRRTRLRLTEWRLWRQPLGIGITIFGLACLVALVVVASVREADTLSVVALTLAVIAFLLQIIVFVADTVTNAQLNADTRRVLENVQDLLGQRFDFLLQNALTKTVGADTDDEEGQVEEAGPVDQPVTAAELERALRENFDRVLYAPTAGQRQRALSSMSASKDETLARFRRFPDREESPKLIELFESLSPAARAALTRYATSEVAQRQNGRRVGLRASGRISEPVRQQLMQAGLLDELRPERDGQPGLYALTNLGRDVARLFTGHGPAPDYLSEWLLHRPREGSRTNG